MIEDLIWKPTPSSEEIFWYLFGKGLRAEYESGSNAFGAWVGPSRIWFERFDRLA